LTFNITTAANASLSAAQAAAFNTAATAWSAVLSDPITVNLQVGFVSLGSGILGSTYLTLESLPTASVVAALGTDAKDANDAKAVASIAALPPTTPNLELTSAQAKALGYSFTGNDAVIEFSTNYTFSTGRDAQGGTPAGQYDLIGVAEHEIGHALGFVSSFDFNGDLTVLDLFRYTSFDTRASTTGSTFFSLDKGATSLAKFSPGANDNYQASHWLQGTGSLMDPAVAAGVSQNITALDIKALDVIGYDVIVVAEPASLTLLFGGIALAIARRRRPDANAA